jgi:hypothetical protein
MPVLTVLQLLVPITTTIQNPANELFRFPLKSDPKISHRKGAFRRKHHLKQPWPIFQSEDYFTFLASKIPGLQT